MISAVSCLLIFLLFFAGPLYNNIVAIRYLGKLESVPPPEGTTQLASFWEVGKFSGNGNNMEYFVGIVVKTNQSEAALLEYYQAAGLPPARASHTSHQVQVGRIENGRPRFAESYSLRGNYAFPTGEEYRVVALYDGGYSATIFDIRGN